MKKWIFVGLFMMMATGCSVETVEPETQEVEQVVVEEKVAFVPRTVEASYINVESERLNVRMDADAESEKVGAVLRNEKLQIISEKYDAQKRIWYEIKTKEGTVGYVAGWFCAKTKITIRVEENTTSIVGIEVDPIPNYIDNPFDKSKVEVGDQIVGFTIRELSQIGDLSKIAFDGEVKLTGNFYHENSDLSTGKIVRFVPDEASSVLLPRYQEGVESVWFILSDYETVASKFGVVGTTGFATITVKNYTISYGAQNAYNQASLVNVVIE